MKEGFDDVMRKKLRQWRYLPMLVLTTLVLAGCGEPFVSTLQPAGEVAQTQYDLMILSTIIMVLVIIVVMIIFFVVIFRFRRKKGDDSIPKQVEGNHKLEIIWTVIPILLLLVLAVPTVTSTFYLADVEGSEEVEAVEPEEGEETAVAEGEEGGEAPVVRKDEGAIVVNVTANLYWWEFEYPDQGIVTGQELVVPTDEKVYFNLTSADVKHAFWIPAVGGKLDTNPDNINKFWLEFDSAKSEEAGGLFYGKCAELCGPSHALMDFKVKALDRAEFDTWVTDMQNAEAPDLQTELAQQGEQIFTQSCISCHSNSPTEKGSAQGPNLGNFGERSRIAGILEHNEENLKAWISDPEQFKPGNKMTGVYQLEEDEIDAVAAYLLELKVQD